MPQLDKKRQEWSIGLVLCLVTFLLYLGVLANGFVNYDDYDYVKKNPYIIDGLTSSTVVWAFTSTYASNWHPLTWISHALDWQMFGPHPGGHHLVNVLFHVANTLLLFLVLRRLTGATWRSALVSALFAWHPLHVESVAWISERKDVLSTLFWLLTLLSYTAYVQQSKIKNQKSKIDYWLALLFFALGLMSKPMLVTVPFLLLLLDYWPLRRSAELGVRSAECSEAIGAQGVGWKQLVIEKWPFFALTFISCVITAGAQRGAMVEIERVPLPMRLSNALLGYAGYLRKMFWPSDLGILYPLPHSIPAAHWLAAAAVLLAISVAAIALRRTQPYLLMGWLWFLGTLVPVIGLVQVGSQAMADRYTYMPLTGVFIMLVWGGAELLKNPVRQKIGWAAAAICLAACMAMTWMQIQYWKDTETLFRRDVAVTTHNVFGHIDLGRALDDAGHPAEAKAEFDTALHLEPQSPAALTALGVHYFHEGDATNAIASYQAALASRPDYGDAHYNLGNVFAHIHRFPEAEAEFTAALRLNPDASDVHNNLGAVLMAMGKPDEAIAEFQTALRINPNFPEAHAQLASVLLKRHRLGMARVHYAEAVRLKPDFTAAQLKLGLVMAEQGDVGMAIPHFIVATKLEPNAEAFYDLGAAYAALQNWPLSVEAFNQALKLKPGDIDTQKRLEQAKAMASQPKIGKLESVTQQQQQPQQAPSTNLQAPENTQASSNNPGRTTN